jgi:hypothetical protein
MSNAMMPTPMAMPTTLHTTMIPATFVVSSITDRPP